ncbi:Transcription factor COE2 [Intoshia linei]|uniref:Transcription factor COE2 n=1 Tax=Intoshia linei TaxID=1819745 RepID=A0A177B910_9BILA|nr:Transcription factor COE2 [Intoshia linei]
MNSNTNPYLNGLGCQIPHLATNVPSNFNMDIKFEPKIWSNCIINEPVICNDPHISQAIFKKHPPENLRKSNFFHFIVTLYDKKGSLIEVEKAKFIEFVEDTLEKDEKVKTRNGIVYNITIRLTSDERIEKTIYVRLVDSISKEFINYEGQNKNPDMCRVLLTHEIMCSRCCEKKSCGNRNETPSDPIIIDRYYIKFFMKCNQNCLKNAGNPRDMRRFKVSISSTLNCPKSIMCISDNMFVHNNSKHGRKNKKNLIANGNQLFNPSNIPNIKTISPTEGWMNGGTEVIVIGENFFDGIQVAFGTDIVWAEVLSEHAVKVLSPPTTTSGYVQLTLLYKSKPFYKISSVRFRYNNVNEPTIDVAFQRLIHLIPRFPGDPIVLPKEIVLKRAGDIIESQFCSIKSNTMNYGYPVNNHNIYQQRIHNLSLLNQPVSSNMTANTQEISMTQSTMRSACINGTNGFNRDFNIYEMK